MIKFNGDTLEDLEGIFAGIQNSENSYQFIIRDKNSNQDTLVSINRIRSIYIENGKTLNQIPEANNIILLYEKNGNVYRAPLEILKHINSQNTNNKIVLGTFGLAVDAAILIISYSSISVNLSGW